MLSELAGSTGPATDAEWRLAEAHAILRRFTDRAQLQVAERIGALALAGDAAGVERWRQIAVALDSLIQAPRR